MTSTYEGGIRPFDTDAAIARYSLVKFASADTVTVSGATDAPLGTVLEQAHSAGQTVAVRLLNRPGTMKCIAAGPFAAGAVVYGVASGQVDDVAAGNVRVGVALEAAAAAGDIVEILPD